jgi:hypothetical protein
MPTNEEWRIGRIFFEWAAVLACIIALVQGAGSISKWSIIALAIFGSAAALTAIFEHKFNKVLTIVLALLVVSGMSILAFAVWPKPVKQIVLQVPKITWPEPKPIVFGRPLTEEQLNAAASVPGRFDYTPTFGTVAPVGTIMLTALFTPQDNSRFSPQEAHVVLTVLPQTPAKIPPVVPTKPAHLPPQNGDHSLYNNGTNNGEQKVEDNRQYGVPKPPPEIIGLSVVQVPPVAALQIGPPLQMHGPLNPGLQLSFHVADDFQSPRFKVMCNRPCSGSFIEFATDKGSTASWSGSPFRNSGPREVIFGAGMRTEVTPDIRVVITVRSSDDEPLTSAKVEGYVQ